MDIRQYRKDTKYLIQTYGNAYDYCGGWCNNDILNKILFIDHSSKNIKNVLLDMMIRIIQVGYDDYDRKGKITEQDYKNDGRLREIIKRYDIDINDLID